MPRNPEQNAQLREARGVQILDAALAVYVRCGYHGTDMDEVARQAGLAKGLVYYYFKTKQELFAALYTKLLDEGMALSEKVLWETRGLPPIERLMRYTHAMFGANRQNPRLMPFYMRMPFDAAAVFGPDAWRDGAAKSDRHRRALAGIIADGIAAGALPAGSAGGLAASFWTVFVGSLFEYSKLMLGQESPALDERAAFTGAVCFAFRGLGAEEAQWQACLERVMEENNEEAPA